MIGGLNRCETIAFRIRGADGMTSRPLRWRFGFSYDRRSKAATTKRLAAPMHDRSAEIPPHPGERHSSDFQSQGKVAAASRLGRF
jgi:hypothetical protein